MLQIELFIESIITQFGLSVVLLILISKGLLIGKPLPATTAISTYAILIGYTTLESIFLLCLLTASATTFGELIIFTHCKNPNHKLSKYIPEKIKNISNSTEDEKSNKYINKLFTKFSNNIGLTVFVGNITVGIRGFASIVAGKNKYSTYKFLIISYISTLIYHTTLTYLFVTGFTVIF